MSYDVLWGPQDYYKIADHCIGDNDGILGMKYNIGTWVAISDNFNCIQSVEGYKAIPAEWKSQTPCKPPTNPHRWRSFSTSFDSGNLEDRSSSYQVKAVIYFAEYLLADYLVSQKVVIPPDRDLERLLDGRIPTTFEELVPVLQNYPLLARKMRLLRGRFDPRELAPSTLATIYRLLKNRSNLASYLSNAREFVYSRPDDGDFVVVPDNGEEMPNSEREALILASEERRQTVLHAYDHIELGGAPGDANVFVLIGLDREARAPSAETWEWARSNIAAFADKNEGIIPAVGYYLSEAQLRYWVVAGPKVEPRALDFLSFSGSRVIDRRDGGSLDATLDELLEYEYKPISDME